MVEFEKSFFENGEKLRVVILFGPPGSGKGTQGKFLSSAGNHYHLSSGDIFRGLSPDSPAGEIFHKYASKGRLVPDDVTVDIWRYYVQGLIATNCYFPKEQYLLLDGVPRTEMQLELMKSYIDVVHVISLKMGNTDRLIKRLKRRALIEHRMDDFDEGVLMHRMNVYKTETQVLLKQFPMDRVSYFNADQPPLSILRDVLIKLSDLLTYPQD